VTPLSSGLVLRSDGRVLAGGAVVLFFATLLAVHALTGSTPWRTVGVAPGGSYGRHGYRAVSFLDMRSVTSAWDCERRGISAFPINICDPFRRPANYPRIWIWFWHLGLGEGDTVPLAVTNAVLFYLAALAIAGPLTLGEGALYGVALLAPATLFGVEQGNVDLALFALVAAGALLLARRTFAGGAAITGAAVLKLFPAAAIIVLGRERRRWAAAVSAIAIVTAYVIVTLPDIRTVWSVIPRAITNSYGSGVVPLALQVDGFRYASSTSERDLIQAGLILLGLAIAVVLLRWRRDEWEAGQTHRLDAFWIGAAIYAGSWMFGNNFVYRLVFLILCLPQMFAWAHGRRGPVPGARPAVAAVLLTLWLSTELPPLPFGLQSWYLSLSVPPQEALNLFLFGWLVAALVATSPLVSAAPSGLQREVSARP
jgi:hypothetical protein